MEATINQYLTFRLIVKTNELLKLGMLNFAFCVVKQQQFQIVLST
jgi:hypothetical protein